MPNTRWDFFISGSCADIEARAAAFMAATKELGTRWCTPTQEFEHLLGKKKGRWTEYFDKYPRDGYVADLSPNIDLEQHLQEIKEKPHSLFVKRKIFHQMKEQCLAGFLEEKGRRLAYEGSFAHDLNDNIKMEIREKEVVVSDLSFKINLVDVDREVSINQGTIQVRGKKIELRLLALEEDLGHPLRFILSFPNTSVQCFIGPHTACHLYGKLSCRGKIQGCDFNELTTLKTLSYREADGGFEKAEDKEPLLGADRRHGADEWSVVIPAYNSEDADRDVVDEYSKIHERLVWEHHQDSSREVEEGAAWSDWEPSWSPIMRVAPQ